MSTVTYYLNSYDVGEAWGVRPEDMVDNDITGNNYAAHTSFGSDDIQLCDGNTCGGSNLGAISKVELRAYCNGGTATNKLILRPVFGGTSDGDDHEFVLSTTAGWHGLQDITSDTNAPGTWSWTNVQNLECDVETSLVAAACTFRVWKVEIVVTYSDTTDVLTSTDITTGAPTLGTPTLVDANTDILTSTDITTGAPTLGTSTLVDYAPDALTSTDITTGIPTLGTPTLTENINALTSTDITTGVPTLGTPTLTENINALVSINIVTGSPTLGSPILDDGTEQPFAALTPYTDSIGDALAPYTDSIGDALTPYTDSIGDALTPYDDSPL